MSTAVSVPLVTLSAIAASFAAHGLLRPSADSCRRVASGDPRPLQSFARCLLRLLGGVVDPCLPMRLRERLDEELTRWGAPRGLVASELVVEGTLYGLLAMLFVDYLLGGHLAGWMLCLSALPTALLVGRWRYGRFEKTQCLRAERALPDAVDVLRLTLSGGVDARQALSITAGVLRRSYGAHPLTDALESVVRQIHLGTPAAQAIASIQARFRADAMHAFSSAIAQALQDGNALGEQLEQLALRLRQRRSQLAEEAASKAGVIMMIPLMLLMVCALILIVGPFIIQFI